jgi:dye decolorizing peroxidase
MRGEPPEDAPLANGVTRRGLLVGTAAAAAAGAIGFGAGAVLGFSGGAGTPAGGVGGAPVAAHGIHQAGVDRPAHPQQYCLIAVADLDVDVLRTSLAALGTQIAAATAQPGGVADLTPDGPGDLTVTVGLGQRALAATSHPELAALTDLPEFAGDSALAADRRGGDLYISVNSSQPMILEPVLSALLDRVAGLQLRWTEFGFRDPSTDGVARNPLGYLDGIIRPKTDAEFRADVWLAEGPLAGGSICVIRRFLLDAAGFRALSPHRRDEVVGREQSSGAPLSGGDRDDEVDLDAKAPDGTLLVPLHAHARAAHPSFTGSALMLRRGYGYRASGADHGLLFIAFQNDVQTFARTQLRLDEVDDLMTYATPTATAAFAILPGALEAGGLGSTLF